MTHEQPEGNFPQASVLSLDNSEPKHLILMNLLLGAKSVSEITSLEEKHMDSEDFGNAIERYLDCVDVTRDNLVETMPSNVKAEFEAILDRFLDKKK